jgi:hypothetical protein
MATHATTGTGLHSAGAKCALCYLVTVSVITPSAGVPALT